MIAVSSPHRAVAFDACRFAIDTLKETVPIWKKEYFEDGEVWVGLQSWIASSFARPGDHSPSRDASWRRSRLGGGLGRRRFGGAPRCARRAAGGARPHADRVHVHHGLRPEADAEADGVRALCERLGVACHVERVVVRRAPPWDGLEAESRRARHAALERVGREVGAARIATGHTADDQAETVLMRLLQGAGPRGLGGIAPVRGRLRPPADRDAAGRDRGVPGRARARLGGGSEAIATCASSATASGTICCRSSRGSAAPRWWRPSGARRRRRARPGGRPGSAARAELDRLATATAPGSVSTSARSPASVELAAEILRQAAALLGETRRCGAGPARAPPPPR